MSSSYRVLQAGKEKHLAVCWRGAGLSFPEPGIRSFLLRWGQLVQVETLPERAAVLLPFPRQPLHQLHHREPARALAAGVAAVPRGEAGSGAVLPWALQEPW